MNIKAIVETDPRFAGKTLTIITKRNDDYHQVLPFNLVFTPLELGVMATPCLIFDDIEGDDLLKALAQGLADAGYLPDVVVDKNKELEATKYHLEDMRSLVFKRRK